MTITFDKIPNNLRVPGTYIENSVGTAVFQADSKILIVGQKMTSGNANLDQVNIVPDSQEDALFGQGSMLAQMVKVFKKNNPFGTPYVLPVADPVGVPASATITIVTATAPRNLTLSFIIHGISISLSLLKDDTNAEIASALADEINKYTDLLVTASTSTNVVTITARQNGSIFNGMRLYQTSKNEMSITTTDFSGGTGEVNLTGKFDTIPSNDYFDYIFSPYYDNTNLGVYASFTRDRWNPIDGSYGHVITVVQDTLGVLSTLGSGLNDEHLTIIGYKNNSNVTPLFYQLGAVAGHFLQQLTSPDNLSRPLTNISLQGVINNDHFTISERNTLLFDGISTIKLDRAGTTKFERIITTYQTNAAGAQDSTYLDIQTLAQLMYSNRYIKQRIDSVHDREYIKSTTVDDIKSTIIHCLTELQDLAVIDNVDLIIEKMIIQRNATDATRIDAYIPIDHVNPNYVRAFNIESYLELGA